MPRSLSHPVSVEEILTLLGPSVIRTLGIAAQGVISAVPIREANGDGTITFWEGEGASSAIAASAARLVVCQEFPGIEGLSGKDRALIVVSNPRLCFMRILKRFFADEAPRGIHPTAVIHPNAVLHPTAHIGANTYVGRCNIGANAIIHGHVYLYDQTNLGENVVIHAGAIIGVDGFHFHRNETGDLEKFPHLGGVIIEDDVEIGSSVSIARGTLTDTVIGRGTKFDNLVHVAHTVTIGRRCRIGAGATIAGNVVIGDDAWIGPGAVVSNNIDIGDKASVSLGSVVVRDVKESQQVSGNFAVEHRRFLAAQLNSFRQVSRPL